MTSRSEAFAAQAEADFRAYELLTNSGLPSSHRLHYLQMWLEKLCKAYLWLPAAPADDFRTTHNVVAKVLPRMISEHWRRIGFEERPDQTGIRQICRDVALLHPQVDDGGRRPDNVEYPWDGQSAGCEVPARWSFALSQRLHSPEGRLLLKAAMALTRNPLIFMGDR